MGYFWRANISKKSYINWKIYAYANWHQRQWRWLDTFVRFPQKDCFSTIILKLYHFLQVPLLWLPVLLFLLSKNKQGLYFKSWYRTGPSNQFKKYTKCRGKKGYKLICICSVHSPEFLPRSMAKAATTIIKMYVASMCTKLT